MMGRMAYFVAGCHSCTGVRDDGVVGKLIGWGVGALIMAVGSFCPVRMTPFALGSLEVGSGMLIREWMVSRICLIRVFRLDDRDS
jgi:hypothetical protein